MTYYKKVSIEINLKYGIEKKPIPTEVKEAICKIVSEQFPNWSTISYEYKNERLK